MNKLWTDDGWADYLYWQSQDKKTLKRINELIKDIERNGVFLAEDIIKINFLQLKRVDSTTLLFFILFLRILANI